MTLSTQIVEAAGKGDNETVRSMVARGADVNDVNDVNERNWTLLDIAVMRGDAELTEFLLESGADVSRYCHQDSDRTVLHSAVRSWSAAIVKMLLQAGAEIDARDRSMGAGTPLIWAAGWFYRNTDILVTLLQHGADVNAKDSNDTTALTWAVAFGQYDNCKVLIEHGADVNAKNRQGVTPLFVAISHGSFDICKLLLENDADVSCVTPDGRHTPKTVAVQGGHSEIAALIDEYAARRAKKQAELLAHEGDRVAKQRCRICKLAGWKL